ncbi:MAG: ankyrin repeat domain-containing protein [Terriglobia bacterium]
MCHGPEQQMNSFRLDRRGAAMRGGTRSVIVPGNSAASRLYLRLVDDRFGRRMPATGPLPDNEIAIFKAWIDQGAVWPDELANDPVLTPADPKAAQLVAALRQGDAKGLLADAAALNLRGPYGATPFMYAVLYSDSATVSKLLELGADGNVHNDAGATPLMWAVDDFGKTKTLLSHGAKVNAVSTDGRTPLLIAASQKDSTAVIGLLLESGADSNQSSPLREAASRGDLESMKLLIARGANVKAAGSGALAGALERRCFECADLIAKALDQKAFTSALLTLVVYSDPAAIRYVVERGADVNAVDVDGRSPLMYAANNDRLPLETIQLLVGQGAHVNAKSHEGESALRSARLHGNSPVVKFLIASGATGPAPEVEALRFIEKNSAATAVRRALPIMQRADLNFTQKSGCVSCHNEALTGMALATARTAGFRADEAMEAKAVKAVVSFYGDWRERLLQGVPPGGPAYVLQELHAERYRPDLMTDAVARYLRLKQFPDGHWTVGCGGSRNPLCGDEVTNTANSLRALQFYAPTASKEIRQAAGWLATTPVFTNEDRTFRVFGLAWAGGQEEALVKAVRDLSATQRADGGWSDNPYMTSTAYATGEALMALHEGGMAVSDPAWQRGVEFLLRTQVEDGSWFVKSHSYGTQPYFDDGFPHGTDQWISAAATNWAVMALTAR